MKALILGGAGYFGTALHQYLARQGDTVVVLDLNRPEDLPPGSHFIPGDIRDRPVVKESLKGIDVVYHAVAQVPLARDAQLFHSVNVEGTRTVLEAIREAGTPKLIYISSSAVFGIPEKNPVTEETLPAAREAYGQSKYDAEKLCLDYAARDVDVSIIRPRTILGHGRLGIFQILFEWIRQGIDIPVLDGGHNIYQFVHADDLSAACRQAAVEKGSQIYNCGAETFGSMRESLESVCAYARTGSRVISWPARGMEILMNLTMGRFSPLAPYHALMYGRSLYFDIRKAKTRLGWTPQYSNTDMMIQSYQWYLDHRLTLTSAGKSHHQTPLKEGVLFLARQLLRASACFRS